VRQRTRLKNIIRSILHAHLIPACPAFGSQALSRFFIVSRSWRCQTLRTPSFDGLRRRNRIAGLPHFVGDADLAEGRLLDGQRNDGLFDLLGDAVFQHGFLAADLLQRQLAAS
jgi:hypothetical protein